MPTIYTFFSPTQASVMHAIHTAANDVELSPGKELRALNAGLVENAVREELAGLLDISMVGLMLRAWKAQATVRKYLRGAAKGSPENDTVLVPLYEHTIESSHEPYIQISRGGVPLRKIQFSVSLEIAVEGLVLKLGSGRIREVNAGNFTASGTLKCEGVTLADKKSQPLDLPASFEIGEKENADSDMDVAN